jgi:chorismate mutase-like protein
MSDEAKIAALRVNIDAIDTKLVDLMNERARLALQIGIAKGGKNIVRPAREQTVMANISAANKGPLSDEGIQEIFKKIIAVCRQIQYNREP